MKMIGKKVTVNLPLWLYDALKQEAEENQRPLSYHIRWILWNYAEQN